MNIPEDAVEPMIIDDNSVDQVLPPSYGLGDESRYVMPLQCHTSTASVLRNYRHNPLISGVNLQLSPVFQSASCDGDASSVASLEDSMPPALTACDTDASSDSGIDDNSLVETRAVSPQKLQLPHLAHHNKLHEQIEAAPPPLDVVSVASASSSPPPLEADIDEQEATLIASNGTSRKSSISFMDSSNPLQQHPLWKELCTADYNMSDIELTENQLETVLGWPDIA